MIRYFILFPTRIIVTIISVSWLIVCTAAIGCLPDGAFKRTVYWHSSLACFRIMARAFSGIVTFHDKHNMAKPGGITVANHTSPIVSARFSTTRDAIPVWVLTFILFPLRFSPPPLHQDVSILACDNCYALVGQSQGGFLGVLQGALQRASNHIWFERFELKDRQLVTQRLKEHVSQLNNLPILIFPEGTCINNSAVMMFKKGSFEVNGTVYPVAIKVSAVLGTMQIVKFISFSVWSTIWWSILE